jgi:hypothetical protein
LVLFSLFTALVSVTLIGGNLDIFGVRMKQLEQDAARAGQREDQILTELTKLHERLERMEQRQTPQS